MFKLFRKPTPPLPTISAALGLPEYDEADLKDVPRYPVPDAGLPVIAPERLLATHKQLAMQIHFSIDLRPAEYKVLIQPVLHRFAAWVGLLPASLHHHHRLSGGLLHHSLDCAAMAARHAQDRMFTCQSGPTERRTWERRWRVATVMAALLHDAGKVVTDMRVSSPDGDLWPATTTPLFEWAKHKKLDRYHVSWLPNRSGQHESAATVLAKEILSQELLDWLTEPGQDAFLAMWGVLGGRAVEKRGVLAPGFLSGIVKQVDSASTERDLANQGAGNDQVALSLTPEWQMIYAMRRLMDEGKWKVNQPGARLWVVREGVFIVWEAAAEEIVAELRRDHVHLPSFDAAALADRFIAGGFAASCENQDKTYRYWLVQPKCLDKVKLRTLRLINPFLLFSDGTLPETIPAIVHGSLPERESNAAQADAMEGGTAGPVEPVPPQAALSHDGSAQGEKARPDRAPAVEPAEGAAAQPAERPGFLRRLLKGPPASQRDRLHSALYREVAASVPEISAQASIVPAEAREAAPPEQAPMVEAEPLPEPRNPEVIDPRGAPLLKAAEPPVAREAVDRAETPAAPTDPAEEGAAADELMPVHLEEPPLPDHEPDCAPLDLQMPAFDAPLVFEPRDGTLPDVPHEQPSAPEGPPPVQGEQSKGRKKKPAKATEPPQVPPLPKAEDAPAPKDGSPEPPAAAGDLPRPLAELVANGEGGRLLATLILDWRAGSVPPDAVTVTEDRRVFLPFPGQFRLYLRSFGLEDVAEIPPMLDGAGLIVRKGAILVHFHQPLNARGLWVEPNQARELIRALPKLPTGPDLEAKPDVATSAQPLENHPAPTASPAAGETAPGSHAARGEATDERKTAKEPRPKAGKGMDEAQWAEVLPALQAMAKGNPGNRYVWLKDVRALLKRHGIPAVFGLAALEKAGASQGSDGRIRLPEKLEAPTNG